LRTGIFAVGATILVFGLIIVMIFQSPLSAMESMFGGWAMMSPDVRQWHAYVSVGWIMVVIGIIIMIPAIILKKKSNKILICVHCNSAFNSESDLIIHKNEKHSDEKKW